VKSVQSVAKIVSNAPCATTPNFFSAIIPTMKMNLHLAALEAMFERTWVTLFACPAQARRSGIEAETTRNVPSLFHYVSPFVPPRKLLFLKGLQERFNLFRHISLSIPLSDWSINSSQPTTSLCPKALRIKPYSSNQHTPAHCHTLNFSPRPNVMQTGPKVQSTNAISFPCASTCLTQARHRRPENDALKPFDTRGLWRILWAHPVRECASSVWRAQSRMLWQKP